MVKLPKKKKKKKAQEKKKAPKRKERRVADRQPGRVFACILENSDQRQLDQAFCVVMDVSTTGMRLRTPQPPLNGSTITLRVAVGEDICNLIGRVVRVEEVRPSTFDVGVELDLDELSALAFMHAVRENHVQLELASKS
jgi:hypothetical protein